MDEKIMTFLCWFTQECKWICPMTVKFNFINQPSNRFVHLPSLLSLHWSIPVKICSWFFKSSSSHSHSSVRLHTFKYHTPTELEFSLCFSATLSVSNILTLPLTHSVISCTGPIFLLLWSLCAFLFVHFDARHGIWTLGLNINIGLGWWKQSQCGCTHMFAV